jgi:N-acetylneuraminic acid mutarotase
MAMSKNRLLAVTLISVFLISFLPITQNGYTASASETAKENSWISKAQMHVARSKLGVTVANGKIYAVGGSTEKGYIPRTVGNDYKNSGWISGANEEYDPTTDTWTLEAPMPTPRYSLAVASYQNKIYCIGGITDDKVGYYTNYSGANEVYDPATDTWQTKASMPIAATAQANVVGNKIYVFCREDNTTINQIYDPSTDSWATGSPVPTASYSSTSSTVVGNKIYLVDFSVYLGSVFHSVTEVYDPANDSWSSDSPMPRDLLRGGDWESQSMCATTGVLAPEQVYVLFGFFYGMNHLTFRVYNPTNDNWLAGTDVPSSRYSPALAMVNDTLYVIGGYVINYPLPDDNFFFVNELNATEQYFPIGYNMPPEISVVSPQHGTYVGINPTLAFGFDKLVSWMGYSLDGQANVTIAGNVTLSDLSVGSHSLVIYANDSAGNMGASQTVSFTIAEPPTPEPSPTSNITPSPSPTQNPTATPKPTEQPGFLGAHLPIEYGYGLITTVAVIATVAIAAFTIRKRHPRPK